MAITGIGDEVAGAGMGAGGKTDSAGRSRAASKDVFRQGGSSSGIIMLKQYISKSNIYETWCKKAYKYRQRANPIHCNSWAILGT